MIKDYLIAAWVEQKPLILSDSEKITRAGDWRAAFARAMAILKENHIKKGTRPREITIKLTNIKRATK